MLVLGLASEIGCGKTEVAGLFKQLGARVIDADRIVSQLYSSKKGLRKKLASAFGKEVLTSLGRINRKALAERTFSSKSKLRKLNSIVHPLVERELKARLARFRKSNAGIVVLDVPLLFEAGLDGLADVVVAVKARRSQQLERLKKEKGLSHSQAMQRIKAQMPLSKKIKLADFVIDNTGRLSHTRKQVSALFKALEFIESVK